MLIWPDHPAFSAPLSQLRGVGPKTLARLEEEGFHTTGDLLALPPRFYQDRRRPVALSELVLDPETKTAPEALVEVVVISAKARWSPKSRRRFLEAKTEDEDGRALTLLWFNFPAYMLKSLTKGRRIKVFGRVRLSGADRLEIAHPDLEFLSDQTELIDDREEETAEVRPVYPPIGELPSSLVKKLLDQIKPVLQDCPPLFPAGWLAANRLTDPISALATLHSPPGDFSGPLPRPSQTRAFRHLALFELVFWRLLMLRVRPVHDAARERPGADQGRRLMEAFWAALPFQPSPEQKRVAAELADDLRRDRPMSRLLQGEVGGGKTAVAGAALFFALGSGGQGAIMAPTEVLARQHYDFLRPLAESMGFETVLLTGALSEKEKRAARAALAEGRAHLAVGSQALLSPATVFGNLTLAVIDEQHRFGVRQRLALRRKNSRVDLLAMSATPIPRSLTLMLYGDLDSISLEGLLPGRTPAETSLFEPGARRAAYLRFLELVRQGGQGFLVCPRIEAGAEDEESPLPSLDDIYRQLKKLAGPDLPIDRLHGQMDPADRERVMAAFRDGRTSILVATSIIEVGVDVPAARVILIEGAERFGLAQLHQLRGRVGRGGQDGHCLLLASKFTPNGMTRLTTVCREHNGQALAEMDLSMRGPGEQMGLRQSGWPKMSYARLPQDLPLLAKAHELAESLWKKWDREPELETLRSNLDFETLAERLALGTEFD